LRNFGSRGRFFFRNDRGWCGCCFLLLDLLDFFDSGYRGGSLGLFLLLLLLDGCSSFVRFVLYGRERFNYDSGFLLLRLRLLCDVAVREVTIRLLSSGRRFDSFKFRCRPDFFLLLLDLFLSRFDVVEKNRFDAGGCSIGSSGSRSRSWSILLFRGLSRGSSRRSDGSSRVFVTFFLDVATDIVQYEVTIRLFREEESLSKFLPRSV